MKTLTRLAMYLSFFVMSSYHVNAASNSVYVEQIGSGSTVDITQTGNSNEVGNSATRTIFNGNNNNVTIEQIGNSNILSVNVQGDGVTLSSLVSGNGNTVDVNCGTSSPCTGSVINNTITGNSNSVTQNTDGLTTSNVTINSDNNTVNIDNTSTAISGTKSTVDISGGNGNTVDIAQAGVAGAAGHEADLTIVGATNTATIKQGGSVDSKVVGTINGSGNTVTIKSNHP